MLGYRCIDRDQVIRKATEWGVSQEDLRTAIEKPPSFLGQSQHTKYRYLAFIQAALTEEVRHGDVIYHGLAGHLLLGKGPHVLRARIIAPMEFRIAKLQGRMNLNRKDAIAYIEDKDADRRKWTRFLYNVDWADPSLYDVVLNLEQICMEAACTRGSLSIKGNIDAPDQAKKIRSLVESIPGVRKVNLEELALATRI